VLLREYGHNKGRSWAEGRSVPKWSAAVQVKDLKEMCKERKIKGYSAMRKSQLVRTLKPILAEEM
jgi:hypothetical protein